MKLLKRIFVTITCLGIFLLAMLFGIGYVNYQDAINQLPINQVKSHMQIERINYREIDEISPDLLSATVAVEDHRFYERFGIDFIAIARAMVKNVLTLSLREGGSTIPQQLAQNVYFDYRNSIGSKMAEYYLLYDFENTYSKDEILEMYVNIIYYGDGYYGIYDASRGYFDKEPNELTLFESTLLAGIPNAPSRYQLSTGLDLALKRQTHVIKRMCETGKIDEATKDELLKMQTDYEYSIDRNG